MKALSVVISGFLLASPALAQDSSTHTGSDRGADYTPGDTARNGDTNAQGERVICRTAPTSSTTRMGQRRVCLTAAQWRDRERTD